MFRDHAASVARCSGPTGKCSAADLVIKEMSGNCGSTRRISIPVPYGAVHGPTLVPQSVLVPWADVWEPHPGSIGRC